MNYLANLFQNLIPRQQTLFEHFIKTSSLMKNNSVIQMSDILHLIECFQGFGPYGEGNLLDGQEYVDEFFQVVKSGQLSGITVIKICVSIHFILQEFQIGDIVAQSMLKYQLPIIGQKDTYSIFVQNYSIYLMKIAQGLKIFYAAKVGQYPLIESIEDTNFVKKSAPQETDYITQSQNQIFTEMRQQAKFSVNNMKFQTYQKQRLEKNYVEPSGLITTHQKVLFLFKLQNLTISALEVLKLLMEQIQKIKTSKCKNFQDLSNFFIEISCILWNDVIVMYKFSGQEINKLLDTFRSQQKYILLSTQQLYLSIISITQKLKLIHNHQIEHDLHSSVKRPFWFDENQKLTSELQDAVLNFKLRDKMQTPKSVGHSVDEFQFPQKNLERIKSSTSKNSISNTNSQLFFLHKVLERTPQEEYKNKEDKRFSDQICKPFRYQDKNN